MIKHRQTPEVGFHGERKFLLRCLTKYGEKSDVKKDGGAGTQNDLGNDVNSPKFSDSLFV